MAQLSDTRPTVLLTGFGPFPGIPVNASADLVRKLVRLARRAFPEFRFVVAVLPTEWRRAPRRIATLQDRHQPVLALHFGVASETQSIRLELRAENICRPSLDAAGLLPHADTLCDDGPAVRDATIEIEAISDALSAQGCACTTSDDAGGYLCNAVLYQSLANAEARGRGAVGFVHIPADLSAPPLKMDEAIAGGLKIIATALETAHPRTA